MKEAELEKYRTLLLKKKNELLDEMGIIMDSQISSTIKDATGDISSYSYHMADQGTDNMGRELAFMFASKSGRLVYHIDEALQRMEKGTYGKCMVCNKQIRRPRLTAVPHARMCINCKSAEEEKKAGRKKA
jgi:RNA polymerase-binding protein DksA